MTVFLVSQFTEPKLSHYGIETATNDHSQSVSIEWERDTEAEQSPGPHSSALTMSTIHTDSDTQSEDTSENPIFLSQSVTRKSDCDSPAIPSTPSPLLLKDDEIDSGPTTTNITVLSHNEYSTQSNNARQSHGGNMGVRSDARPNSTASPILARWSANHSSNTTRTPPSVQQVYTCIIIYTQFIHA